MRIEIKQEDMEDGAAGFSGLSNNLSRLYDRLFADDGSCD